MSASKPIYDLVLLLDPTADDAVREKVLADTEAEIKAKGELIGRHDWGRRTMTYEIAGHLQADYHLLQMHASSELLESLGHALRITDGVIRYRIVKLAPGTPEPPAMVPAAVVATPAAPAAGELVAVETGEPALED